MIVDIMLINLWGTNAWQIRKPLLKELISANTSNNYILLFQEAFTKPHKNFLSEKYSDFQVAQGETGEGLAVISDMALTTLDTLHLSQDTNDPDDRHQRIACFYQLNDLIIVNVHLALGITAQERNLTQILDHVDDNYSSFSKIIIGGDFNFLPEQLPKSLLLSSGFSDVLDTLEMKEFVSWPVSKQLVIDSYISKNGKIPEWPIIPRRVDFLFTKGVNPLTIERLAKKTVSLGKEMWHSDHFIVKIQFKI